MRLSSLEWEVSRSTSAGQSAIEGVASPLKFSELDGRTLVENLPGFPPEGGHLDLVRYILKMELY